jgi:tRNA dimethylallyltransferase
MSDTDLNDTTDLIPLVAVIGPTGVGKTALGVRLARTYGGEIISVDSRQFYRHMNIGTAKPTPDELVSAHHHLIDIADPDETVGLARFLTLARAAVREVAMRERLPVLVGGTGQYIRALLQGWRVPDVPPDPELREELERAAEDDPEALWDRLMALDPAAEEFIHPNNLRRVIRALEVTLKSGVRFSELRRRVAPPYRVLKIGLTMDRDALYTRVDARVDAMIEKGLVEEVKHLLNLGYGWDLPAMSGLGYIQFRPYLEGKASLDEAIERIKLDTHDFIRRQYAWFSPNAEDIHWLDASDPDHVAEAKRLVAGFLSNPEAGTAGRDREG